MKLERRHVTLTSCICKHRCQCRHENLHRVWFHKGAPTDPDAEAALQGVGGGSDLDAGGGGRAVPQLPLQALPQLHQQGRSPCTTPPTPTLASHPQCMLLQLNHVSCAFLSPSGQMHATQLDVG